MQISTTIEPERLQADDPYARGPSGIFVAPFAITHRDDEFNQSQLEIYSEIESRHFWFAGRRRFVEHALRWALTTFTRGSGLRAIDLGAGCGGWVGHVARSVPGVFAELAIGDSSLRALQLASRVVGTAIERYRVDLRRLCWCERWDVVFLLYVTRPRMRPG